MIAPEDHRGVEWEEGSGVVGDQESATVGRHVANTLGLDPPPDVVEELEGRVDHLGELLVEAPLVLAVLAPKPLCDPFDHLAQRARQLRRTRPARRSSGRVRPRLRPASAQEVGDRGRRGKRRGALARLGALFGGAHRHHRPGCREGPRGEATERSDGPRSSPRSPAPPTRRRGVAHSRPRFAACRCQPRGRSARAAPRRRTAARPRAGARASKAPGRTADAGSASRRGVRVATRGSAKSSRRARR